MPFKHACFVSYVHDHEPLMRRFIDELVEGLKSSLGPFVDSDRRVFVDRERLKPSYRFTETLAQAMCESACWIMVYVPRYRDHTYCRREFLAMLELERRRRVVLGEVLGRDQGMIIPIVLRGDVRDLPPAVRDYRLVDTKFQKFTTTEARMSANPNFNDSIETIAQAIWDVWRAVRHTDLATTDCSRFELPEDDPGHWDPEIAGARQRLPGRG